MGTLRKTAVDDFIRNMQLMAHLTRHYIEGEFIEEATRRPFSFVHMNLLRILDQHPGRTVGDIAKYMSVSYPAATKTIDKLVQNGYVNRQEDTHDRRVSCLSLTPEGRQLVLNYNAIKRKKVSRIIKRFNGGSIDSMNIQMQQFARALVDTYPIKAGVCLQCGAFDPSQCKTIKTEKTCGYLESTS